MSLSTARIPYISTIPLGDGMCLRIVGIIEIGQSQHAPTAGRSKIGIVSRRIELISKFKGGDANTCGLQRGQLRSEPLSEPLRIGIRQGGYSPPASHRRVDRTGVFAGPSLSGIQNNHDTDTGFMGVGNETGESFINIGWQRFTDRRYTRLVQVFDQVILLSFTRRAITSDVHSHDGVS